MFFLLTMSPAKVEYFSSKCEKCEESSYFRICDSPAEECSACTRPRWLQLRKDQSHYSSNAHRPFHPLAVKIWPPIETGALSFYLGKRITVDFIYVKFNLCKDFWIFFFSFCRWVLCANHTEPVKGFLGRYLRRKLIEMEIERNTRNNDLVKIIDWIPKTWHHLNSFLETHSSSDVTIGEFQNCNMPVPGTKST